MSFFISKKRNRSEKKEEAKKKKREMKSKERSRKVVNKVIGMRARR